MKIKISLDNQCLHKWELYAWDVQFHVDVDGRKWKRYAYCCEYCTELKSEKEYED
jgi:hypothetical protein